MIYIIKSLNSTVVDNNFNILISAAKKNDKVLVLDESNYMKFKYQSKKSLIISGALEYSFNLMIRGYKNVITWVQGLMPEESYMRNNSFIRKIILSKIEKIALKNSICLLFVSNAMKVHFENKYKLRFIDYYIFPCFNTGIFKDSFLVDGKYDENIFVYAGGTAVWQGLDKIVEAYSKIQFAIKNSKFLFLIKDSEYALSLVKKYNILNYEINYVKKEELNKELSKAKFGFILRDDNVVNNVSTPTKISTYLSCGVIPIVSSSIYDFCDLMRNKNYKIIYNEASFLSDIISFSNVTADNIMKEYTEIFNDYYNNDKYIEDLSKILFIKGESLQ